MSLTEQEAIQRLRRHYSRLKDERSTWDSYWRDVKKYMCPGYGRFLSSQSEVNNGSRNDNERLDGEAGRALDIMANGIQSGLTSKARQWFLLQNPDVHVGKMHSVKMWYAHVQDVIEGIFLRSNVYSVLRNVYYEMGAFGQACMSVSYDPDNTISCRSHTCGTYCLEANASGEVDSVFYVEWLTASQLVEKYGKDAVPRHVLEAADGKSSAGAGRQERYETINLVTASPWRYGLEGTELKPVVSVHFLSGGGGNGWSTGSSGEGGDRFLRQSGYATFPFMCPRWSTVDSDVYGWAPSRDIMGDVKMLQKMKSDELKGLAKIVTPPMRIPPEMERRGLNMRAGGLNVVTTLGDNAVAPLYTVGIDIQQLAQAEQLIRQNIKDGLYNSLFLAILLQDTPQMTATEVQARNNEKMLMLGPVLERIHYELLNPLIYRTFRLAFDDGLIDPPPEELLMGGSPGETKIEYVSILSQAQKAVGVSRIEQSVSFLGSILQLAPETRHLVDWFRLYRTYNDMIGVREDVFRSEDEYRRAVEAEARQRQMAQGAPVAEGYANAAKAVSEANPANIQQLLSGAYGGTPL